MNAAILNRRDLLVRMAVELLEEAGPAAVTTRKVAKRAGTTTMAFYTEFGSAGGLVAGIVDYGFEALGEVLGAIPSTDDPIADIREIGTQYRRFALQRPHLFRTMYAITPVAGHVRGGPELLQGTAAFGILFDAMKRLRSGPDAQASQVFAEAVQLWAAAHGVVTLELSGYLASIPNQSGVDLVFGVVDKILELTSDHTSGQFAL